MKDTRYCLNGPSYTSLKYTSIAKLSVKRAVKTTTEAAPKGMKSIRRAILFHLHETVQVEYYLGNQPTFSPVIGSILSPSVT